MSSQNGWIENRIIDAAQELLDSSGPSFTMEQLESKTRISRATLYRRVGNKKALLKHLAEQRGETFEESNVELDILKAARVVFGKEGLASATIEQIAAEGNVGVATIYRHFGDKETLVLAFIDRMSPRTAVNQIALGPTEDVRADLEKMVGAVMPLFFEHRDIFRFALAGNRSDRRYLEGLRARSGSTLSRLTSYFEAQIDAGRLRSVAEPVEMALAIMGMVLSFSVIGPTSYGTQLEDPRRCSKLIVDLFLNELTTNRSQGGER